jgi:SAM-dependent methyltransferase
MLARRVYSALAMDTPVPPNSPPSVPAPCPICGQVGHVDRPVLWPDLIATWGLSEMEVALIDRQQGRCCVGCGASLRSQTLGAALCDVLGWRGTLQGLLAAPSAAPLQLLEINEAGSLSPWLRCLPGRVFAGYPQFDMQRLAFPDRAFDLVIHSDTLEHVPDPVLGLRECHRVLKPGGCLLLTIPILPTRLTRRRRGMPPSYHGSAAGQPADYLVQTEYGADFFLDFIAAGWTRIALRTLGTPDSLAITCFKPLTP